MPFKTVTPRVSYRLVKQPLSFDFNHINTSTSPHLQRVSDLSRLLQNNIAADMKRIRGPLTKFDFSAENVALLRKIVTVSLSLHSTKTGLVVWYPIICGFRKLWILIIPLLSLLIEATFACKYVQTKRIRMVFKKVQDIKPSLNSFQRLQIFRTLLTSGLSHCGLNFENFMEEVIVLDSLHFDRIIQSYFQAKLYHFSTELVDSIKRRVQRRAAENDNMWKPRSATISPQFDQVAFGKEWSQSHVIRLQNCLNKHRASSSVQKGHIIFHKRKKWFVSSMLHSKRKIFEIYE